MLRADSLPFSDLVSPVLNEVVFEFTCSELRALNELAVRWTSYLCVRSHMGGQET